MQIICSWTAHVSRQIEQRVKNALDNAREEPRLPVSIVTNVYPNERRTARSC
jgi:hypothetical protein